MASVGSTLHAAREALSFGIAGTLAGGTHHAFRDEGAGFLVFNDLAVAIEDLRARNAIRRFAIVDLDVHQGDGTAAIFSADTSVFTFSVHARKNFPFCKRESRLDVELEDGTQDSDYSRQVEKGLAEVWRFRPELILYQSGVDGLQSDRLGRLRLSAEGLRQRDELVIGGAKRLTIPLAITLAEGIQSPSN